MGRTDKSQSGQNSFAVQFQSPVGSCVRRIQWFRTSHSVLNKVAPRHVAVLNAPLPASEVLPGWERLDFPKSVSQCENAGQGLSDFFRPLRGKGKVDQYAAAQFNRKNVRQIRSTVRDLTQGRP
jgi:hypothetical protein